MPLSFERPGGLQQPVARHDDPVVGRDQVFLGAIDDRPHAFLQGGVLHGDAFDTGIGDAFALRLAVHQIVVVLVGARTVVARHVGDMDALAVLHRLPLLAGQSARTGW